MSFANLTLMTPATSGLRLVAALSSDRFWFMIAVLVSLLVSFEVALILAPSAPHVMDGGFGL